jgi:hypothetical protein
MSDTIEIRFPLDVDDDWPPVSIEGLPFNVSPLGYVLTVPPLFIRDLSVGDVIAAEVSIEGLVTSFRYVSRSDNSVVWLLRIGETQEIDGILNHCELWDVEQLVFLPQGSIRLMCPGMYQLLM